MNEACYSIMLSGDRTSGILVMFGKEYILVLLFNL